MNEAARCPPGSPGAAKRRPPGSADASARWPRSSPGAAKRRPAGSVVPAARGAGDPVVVGRSGDGWRTDSAGAGARSASAARDGSAGMGRSRVVRSVAVSAGASAERGGTGPRGGGGGRSGKRAEAGGGGGARGAWSGRRGAGAGRGPSAWTGSVALRPAGGSGVPGAGGAVGRGGMGACRASVLMRPRFLVPGPDSSHTGRPSSRTRAGRPHVARIPARPDRRPAGTPARGRSAVRARHFTGCPRRCGNQSTTAGHLPGTSPYPAVILSGRLRS